MRPSGRPRGAAGRARELRARRPLSVFSPARRRPGGHVTPATGPGREVRGSHPGFRSQMPTCSRPRLGAQAWGRGGPAVGRTRFRRASPAAGRERRPGGPEVSPLSPGLAALLLGKVTRAGREGCAGGTHTALLTSVRGPRGRGLRRVCPRPECWPRLVRRRVEFRAPPSGPRTLPPRGFPRLPPVIPPARQGSPQRSAPP